MTDEELKAKCENILQGAKALEARFYAAPFDARDSLSMIDVTDVVLAAMRKVVGDETDG